MNTKRKAKHKYNQLGKWINAQAEVKANMRGMTYNQALHIIREQQPRLFERYNEAWSNYKHSK